MPLDAISSFALASITLDYISWTLSTDYVKGKIGFRNMLRLVTADESIPIGGGIQPDFLERSQVPQYLTHN